MADNHDFKKFLYKNKDSESEKIKVFKKQDQAIASSEEERKSTFSCEIGRNGIRNFISCNLQDFWLMYEKKKLKNYYEVIQHDKIVKLFYDLEFDKMSNPKLCGEELTLTLIREVIQELKNIYNIQTTQKECLILESTDSKKFSIHLIFFNIYFENIFEVGRFVKDHLSRIDMNILSKRGESISFVDCSIYTRNRNFRIYLSSKYGSNRPLVLSKLDTSTENLDDSDYTVFLRSLISHSNPDAIPLSCPKSQISVRPRTNNGQQTFEEPECAGIDPEIYCSIKKMIHPGKIYKCTELNENFHFSVSSDKFCMKIGRSHSSSNIFYRYNKRLNLLEQGCYSLKCSSMENIKFIVKY